MTTEATVQRQFRISDRGFRIIEVNPQCAIRSPQSRRGAVAVEFALVAPILLSILFGMVQLTRMFEAQTLLETAAREGARLGAMDREGLLQEGQSVNDKIISDVKSFLASNGIPRDSVTVAIKDHENPNDDFDLDDPANDLRLFDVHVSVDLSAVSYMSPPEDYPLTGSITFRNGYATITQ
jgi:hypothetical protein